MHATPVFKLHRDCAELSVPSSRRGDAVDRRIYENAQVVAAFVWKVVCLVRDVGQQQIYCEVDIERTLVEYERVLSLGS